MSSAYHCVGERDRKSKGGEGHRKGRRAGGQAGSASVSASASAYVVLQQSTVASIKTHSLGVHPAIVMIEEGHRKQNHDSAAAEGANHSKVIKQVPENGSANPDCRNLSIDTHVMTSAYDDVTCINAHSCQHIH